MGKASHPVETHGDVENQIKKAHIQGMHSHVAKIDIDAIIAHVSALCENKVRQQGCTSCNQLCTEIQVAVMVTSRAV
jgi:hypothetical protein